MNFKEFIVVVHSGLRGAISIAYGMLAASDQ
jgi:NhaP-type Na+/H+ or K+/H+ antiporter